LQIKHVQINNFRGIKELDWKIENNFVCLVGPGDSTKSTILDAIELALSPRWNIIFNDSDFFGSKTEDPIRILITLVSLPEQLLVDSKFGLHLRGWNLEKGLHDEPGEEDLKALTLQLKIDSSLEPEWTVINSRLQDGIKISTKDREKFGITQLGGFVDRHLTWGKGTVLSRLTEETDTIADMLSSVGRTARDSIQLCKLPKLSEAAKKVQSLGNKFGVPSKEDYHPHIDIQSLGTTIGHFTLHENNVPLRLSGLGSKRLLAIAMQHDAASQKGGVTLVDELEHGLEPHRIKKLLYELRSNPGVGSKQKPTKTTPDQVFLTTHSPIVITELSAQELFVVRVDSGMVSITQVKSELQDIVRKIPEVFLGKHALVCEGKTELGICKTLDTMIHEQMPKETFAYKGIIPLVGGGSECGEIAEKLCELGYNTALFCDSDRDDLNFKVIELKKRGIEVIQWAGSMATEERLAQDLPWESLIKMVNLAIEENGLQSIITHINNELSKETQQNNPVEIWIESDDLRTAIGLSAKKKNWFKRINLGEQLGVIITECLDSIKTKDLGMKLSILQDWAKKCE